MQIDRNLLIGLAVEITHEHTPFEIAEDLLHLLLNIDEFLSADHKFLRITDACAGEHVEQCAVGVLIVDGFIERHIGIERDMLLPRRRLDRSDDLPRHAEFGKRAEG